MNFAQCFQLILDGKKVRRGDWHRPSHIELKEIDNMKFPVMVMKNGVIGFYSPSNCDMLAEDWYEVYAV